MVNLGFFRTAFSIGLSPSPDNQNQCIKDDHLYTKEGVGMKLCDRGPVRWIERFRFSFVQSLLFIKAIRCLNAVSFSGIGLINFRVAGVSGCGGFAANHFR